MANFEIRPGTRGDLPAVADLMLSGGGAAARGVTREQIAAYAEAVYFDNPWARDDIPSLVSVGADGRLEGFIGVIPRRMRYGDEVLDAAVPGNFKVRAGADGKVNPFVALALLKRFFAGPQALSLTDTANEASRRLWESAGAVSLGLYSLDWFRPIKPAAAMLRIMELARGRPMSIPGAAGLATGALDLVGAPIFARLARRAQPGFALEPLATGALLDLLNGRDRRHELNGAYDERALSWLLGQVGDKARDGRLRQAMVLDDQGRRAGGFIYLLGRSGLARVLLHLAGEGRAELVLHALVSDAAERGASVVTGAVQPVQLAAYKAQRCLMTCNQWILVQSRRAEVLDSFHRGRARLTGLDGERWTHFGDLFVI